MGLDGLLSVCCAADVPVLHLQVDVQQRLAAFAAVLASSLSSSEGAVAAHEPLPRLAVSFVAVNLKVRAAGQKCCKHCRAALCCGLLLLCVCPVAGCAAVVVASVAGLLVVWETWRPLMLILCYTL